MFTVAVASANGIHRGANVNGTVGKWSIRPIVTYGFNAWTRKAEGLLRTWGKKLTDQHMNGMEIIAVI